MSTEDVVTSLQSEAFPHYTAFDAIADGVVVHDPESGAVVDVNEQMCRMHGYSREEFLGLRVEEFSSGEPPFVQEEAERRIQKAAEEGPQVFPWMNRRKDGELFWVEVSLRFATLEGEQRVIATVRDITDRKVAEQQLRAEKAFTEEVINSLEEVFFVLDEEGYPVQWNGRVNEVTGYTDAEISSMHATEFVPEEERPRIVESIQSALARGKSRFETVYLTKDGRRIPYEFTGSVLRRNDRRLICGTGRNITDRKAAEKALKESEEKFRTLAEGALVGVVLIQDGKYEYVNPRFGEILDYPRETLLGKPAEWIAEPGDKQRVRDNVRKRLQGEEEAIRYAFRARRKNGETAHLEVFGARISYRDRPAVIGSALDVTEEKRLQREILQVQEAERRQMGRDLHDWIASQLTGVTMMLRGLIDDAEAGARVDPDELRNVVALVRESMSDARRLARGLNPGKLDQEGLSAALRHLAEMTERRFHPSCAYWNDGSPATLPEEVTSHLYWIAQEAVTNAIKYAEADEITIALIAHDDGLELRIEDDGRGLREDSDGEGLGLRIMRYRTQLLGGMLSIQSSPQEGTTVKCVVPIDGNGNR